MTNYAWLCIKIVRRNSILITLSSKSKDTRLAKLNNHISGSSPLLCKDWQGREVISFNICGSRGHALHERATMSAWLVKLCTWRKNRTAILLVRSEIHYQRHEVSSRFSQFFPIAPSLVFDFDSFGTKLKWHFKKAIKLRTNVSLCFSWICGDAKDKSSWKEKNTLYCDCVTV